MERALTIDSKIPAHYRMDIAYQTNGEKAKAISAYQQFLTYTTSGKAVEVAKQRLETLKRTGWVQGIQPLRKQLPSPEQFTQRFRLVDWRAVPRLVF